MPRYGLTLGLSVAGGVAALVASRSFGDAWRTAVGTAIMVSSLPLMMDAAALVLRRLRGEKNPAYPVALAIFLAGGIALGLAGVLILGNDSWRVLRLGVPVAVVVLLIRPWERATGRTSR
jgi:hypothetical protein